MNQEPKYIYKTRTALIQLLPGDIIYYNLLLDSEVELSDVEEYLEIQRRLAQGKVLKNLTDIRKNKSISLQARNRLKGEDVKEYNSYTAIIVGSPLSRVVGRFFMQINPPEYPTRLFTKKEAAMKWLESV